jgi:ABC-type proline/glycine betaine transport system ATPase subunit
MSDRIAIVQQGTIVRTVQANEIVAMTTSFVRRHMLTTKQTRGDLRMRRIFDTQLIGPFAAMILVRSSLP